MKSIAKTSFNISSFTIDSFLLESDCLYFLTIAFGETFFSTDLSDNLKWE